MSFKGSIFNFIAKLFKKHSVRAILVGGYALNAYKIQRMTFDIDFMITKDEYSRIQNDLANEGYELFNQCDAFVQLRGNQPGLRDIDFLLSDEITISRLIENGTVIQIAGEDFTVPAPIHLIAMKLHSISNNKNREIKDLQDIIQIIRKCNIDMSSSDVIALFNKYNLMSLYEKNIENIN